MPRIITRRAGSGATLCQTARDARRRGIAADCFYPAALRHDCRRSARETTEHSLPDPAGHRWIARQFCLGFPAYQAESRRDLLRLSPTTSLRGGVEHFMARVL